MQTYCAMSTKKQSMASMMVGRAEEKTNEYGCLLLVCKARFTDYLWEKKS